MRYLWTSLPARTSDIFYGLFISELRGADWIIKLDNLESLASTFPAGEGTDLFCPTLAVTCRAVLHVTEHSAVQVPFAAVKL